MATPACQSFLASFTDSCELAQVRVARTGDAFELRHVADAADGVPTAELDRISAEELHELVQTSPEGFYRPLKSAPNLRRGWVHHVPDPEALEAVLQQLVPGALPDLHAARQSGFAAVTYRDHTNRQTGMYRLTAKLDDALVRDTTRACCQSAYCLKHRLWTAPGETAPPLPDHPVIPCLEPCAVLLELARKAMRIAQEDRPVGEFSKSELQSLHSALELAATRAVEREADFADERNPRRNALLKLKVAALIAKLQEEPE